MAYTFDEPRLGLLQITAIDSGITPPNQSTKIPTPPMVLGQVVRAFDPTYGGGEFILLCGVASTVVGSCVIYDGTTYLTTLCPVTANLCRPVAFAMSANVSATTFGWYQIGGTAVALKTTSAKVNATVAIGIVSVGKIGASATGKEIEGARSANTATSSSASTTVTITIDRPAMQGRIT